MKYIVMLGDGMADYPVEALGGKTPLEVAKKPNIDRLARGGRLGMVKTCLLYTSAAEGRKVRVVSMPSMDIFEEQSAEYRESVLPKTVRRRVAVEALGTFGWERYTGLDGVTVGMNSFGASAPAGELFRHFGFTAERVAEAARGLF